jgi:hypothetical protein
LGRAASGAGGSVRKWDWVCLVFRTFVRQVRGGGERESTTKGSRGDGGVRSNSILWSFVWLGVWRDGVRGFGMLGWEGAEWAGEQCWPPKARAKTASEEARCFHSYISLLSLSLGGCWNRGYGGRLILLRNYFCLVYGIFGWCDRDRGTEQKGLGGG